MRGRRALAQGHSFLLFVVLLLFTGGDHIGVEDVSLLALFVALLWIYPAELMQKYRISPLLSYGYFMGFLIVAFFFGLFLVSSFASALTPLATMLAAAASVLLGTACFISDAHIKNMAKSEAALIDEMRVATPQGEVKLHSLRCRKIADTYLLSKRESEILFYSGQGQKVVLHPEGTVRFPKARCAPICASTASSTCIPSKNSWTWWTTPSGASANDLLSR